MNLLKIVSRTDWGGDRKVLLHLYRSLIRSKLDYGSIVYGSASKTTFQMLDPAAHQGLRLKERDSSFICPTHTTNGLQQDFTIIENTSNIPPWTLATPIINFDMTKDNKNPKQPKIYTIC